MIATQRGRSHRRTRRANAVVLAAALGLGMAAVAQPAAAADVFPAPDPWIRTEGAYYRATISQAYVQNLLGVRPAEVELTGNIGPAGTIAEVALDPSGQNYTALFGPLAPGLYTYTYTATMTDRSMVTFKEPTSPVAITSQPTWNTFFVPGPSVAWMSDLAIGGTVSSLTYDSPVTGAERSASVWTPPGYDADAGTVHPVLYLLDGEGQTATEWAELGRAPQILDNLAASGELAQMVVVMADANVADPRVELLDGIVPAVEAAYEVSDTGAGRAVAGIGKGATTALNTLLTDAGAFSAVGSFSGSLLGSISAARAAAINDATDLIRVYTGNVLDPAYNSTHSLLTKLSAAGVEHQFDGVTPGSGGTWATWRQNLRDFASRVFRDVSPAPTPGNLPLTGPYTAPAPGSITTPHIGANGIVTFETGTQWSDAKDVTIWANWAPNGAWFRVPMTKQSDGRWRMAMGPLDGFYYYRYVVDGVDAKDPADTVNTLTGVSPLFVPGQKDVLLGDVPAGKGGDLSVMTFTSTVAQAERSAYVWTPPGYDPDRAEPYPVFYLLHGGGQNWGDWVEVGRAKQILDNHYLNGDIVPMVVVMPNGNSSNFDAELMQNIIPAARANYHVSSDPSQQALAGLSMGGMQTLNTWFSRPGEFAYIGAFSGFVFGNPTTDTAALNEGTKLARIYTGDIADFTYNFTLNLVNLLRQRGINHEFAEPFTAPHGFDAWSLALIDFVPRIFRPDTTAGIPIEATVPEGENGVLALTVADYGDGVVLSSAENGGNLLRFEGELPTVTVTDSRTRQQAGTSGWAVSGQSFVFASDVRSLGAEHLGWTPTLLTQRDGLVGGAAVATAMSGG
ncbi:MAG TPA: alpha/beta hydrolase-fold protein, partial [Actinotalea sp.]|nr:alpha/beta hydrolase-fold protein [Actinotalea sp.]